MEGFAENQPRACEALVLLDEQGTIDKWKGVGTVTSPVKRGRVAAKWADHPHETVFATSGIPHDWSGYNALSFWAYSEKANSATVRLVITSENPESTGWDYYTVKIAVEWQGWRKFLFPFSGLCRNRTPVGWHKIDSIAFHGSGWKNVPKPDTVLVFDAIELVDVPPMARVFKPIRPGHLYELLAPVELEDKAVTRVVWLDRDGNEIPVRVTAFTSGRRPGMGEESMRRRYVAPVGAAACRVERAGSGEAQPELEQVSFRDVLDLTPEGLSTHSVPQELADHCRRIRSRLLDGWQRQGPPDRRIGKLLKTQIMDPESPQYGSWGKVKDAHDIQISWVGGWFSKPRDLARGYACPTSEFYHNPELLNHLEAALTFALRFTAVGKPRPGNWWAWDIGGPLRLTEVLLLTGDRLSPGLRAELVQALYDLGYNCATDGFAPDKVGSGANGIWVALWGLRLGVYTRDEALLRYVKWVFDAHNAINTTGGNGIQPDGSYHFHGHGLNFHYGRFHLTSTGEYVYLTGGTPYQLCAEPLANFLHFFGDFAVWNTYGNIVSPYSIGRAVVRGAGCDSALATGLHLLAAGIEPAEPMALSAVHDYCRATGRDPTKLGYLAEKLGDKLTQTGPPLVGVRYYPWSDYMIARDESFFAGVRMSSTRTKSWYSIHEMNLRGYYSGEGTVALMTDGSEYAGRSAVSVTQPWDDLTGITRVVGLHPDREKRGHSTFVGGAAAGRVGCCGMDYRLVKDRQALTGRKTYFALRNVLVMLGTGIHADNTEGEAKTALLMLPANRDAGSYAVDGQEEALEDGEQEWREPKSFFYRNIGVLLPEAGGVRFRCETRKKDFTWIHKGPGVEPGRVYTRQFISLMVNHGQNPQAGRYAVILLPATTLKATEEAAADAPVRIVQHDDDIHAVMASDGSGGAAVFFSPGRCAVGGLSRPGYLAWSESGAELAVCAYAEEKGAIQVAVPGHMTRVSLSPGAKFVRQEGEFSIVELNLTGMAPLRFRGTGHK